MSSGGRLVGPQGQDLPLRSVSLTGKASGGVARVVLAQTFANVHPDPLEVVYTMPLPADGGVAGYTMRVGDKVVRGTVETREEARESFERALAEGRAAGLLDQERTSVFTQRLGNVPPGTQVVVELTIDQRLAWIDGGIWEWRFPTVAAPRYMGAEGRVDDARNVTIDVSGEPLPVRATMALAIADAVREGGTPESPSHDIAIEACSVTLTGDGARLDRDIVVRWPVPAEKEGVALSTSRPPEGSAHAGHAYGLLTIVPPAADPAGLSRDLIVLIDTSGSMDGRPLEKAKEVVGALIDTLADTDRLEMIAFGMKPRRWGGGAVVCTAAGRRKARSWVGELQAGGGTEMTSAMIEALRPLRPESVRQVVLVTDGEIGFEAEVVRSVISGLPDGCRIHTVGIGGAVNRALTRPVARAGRGVEVLVDPDESAAAAARRIVAATRGPVVVDLEIGGDAVTGVAPRRPGDLMAGSPVLVGLELAPGGGDLVVRGRTAGGAWEHRFTVPATAHGQGDGVATTLYGREAVEDLETDLAGGGVRASIDREITRIGLEFALATRLTSWVAVSEDPVVDPRQPARRTRIPQDLPYGMSAEGLGLRPAGPLVAGVARTALTALGDAHCLMQEELREGITRAMHDSDFGPLAVRGRWIAADHRRFFLEFEVISGILHWNPHRGVEVRLHLHNGSEKIVAVDLANSTFPGVLHARMVGRILMEVDEATVARTASVEIVTDGGQISIDL